MWGMMIRLAINNCRKLGVPRLYLPDWHYKFHCMNLVLYPALSCIRLLESRRKGEMHVGCVQIELTSFVTLNPTPCCVGLVSKKDNFLDDGINVMKTNLSGGNQTETWFFERLKDIVSDLRSPCCFETLSLPPCLKHWEGIRLKEWCSFSTKLHRSILMKLSLSLCCPPPILPHHLFLIDKKVKFYCLFESELICWILTLWMSTMVMSLLEVLEHWYEAVLSPWTTSPQFNIPYILLAIPLLRHLSELTPGLNGSGCRASHLNVVNSTSTKTVPLSLTLSILDSFETISSIS